MVDGLQFNVSHADGLALFAFSLTAAVGVDLEYIRRLPDMAEMSKRCFSVAEQQALAGFPDEERDAAFFARLDAQGSFSQSHGRGNRPRSGLLYRLTGRARLACALGSRQQ